MLVPEFVALGKTSGEFVAVRNHDQNCFSRAMNVEQHAGDDIRGFFDRGFRLAHHTEATAVS